jgi:D-lactate dehydrogenase (cytochrome)
LSPTTPIPVAELAQCLENLMGPEAVIRDAAERAYYSQDAFWDGEVTALVVTPACRETLARAVGTATAAGYAVVPRGGGMSYTRGYVPDQPTTVTIDTRRLDHIVEINETDRYVTVEAGCTWQRLYEQLRERGLRTPYFGPMSGRCATVGGALSQNSMFFGSAAYGTVAESVLGLKVVLADGTLLTTGAGANRAGKPFFRHYGPDLTGLFLADTGALGIKVEASLRLIPTPAHTGYASFAFEDFHAMLAAQADIARAGLAAECFGLDPYLNRQRTMVKDLKAGLATLRDLATRQPSLMKGVKAAMQVAAAGTDFAQGVRYSLHVTVDAMHEADLEWRMAEVRRIGLRTGREIAPTIPQVLRATPFQPVGQFLVGHHGERWIPIHACLPLSSVPAVFRATMAYFESKAEVLERFSIATSHLTGSSGTDLIFEPAFYYPDALKPFHLRHLEPAAAKEYATRPAVPGATAAVQEMLGDLARIFMEHGAVHQQLGRFYPYRAALAPETFGLIAGIKRLVDPGNLVNPGVLGLAETGAGTAVSASVTSQKSR